MAVTQSTHTGNGSNASFGFTFPYLKTTDVKITVDGTANTAWSFTNATTVQFNTAPANGAAIIIYRDTANDSSQATFYAGSAIKSTDLNDNFTQTLYSVQEIDNNSISTIGDRTMAANLKLGTYKVVNVGDPTDAQDAVTKAYLERAGSISSTQILDGTILNVDINASAAIAGSKLQASSSSNAGSMSAADKAKLDGIDTGAKDDQTAAEIRALVESASDSNVFTDADHSKLNAIEASATADQTNAEIRAAVEAATDSNVFTDADHTKVNAAATITGSETLTNKTLTSPVINDMSGTAVVTSGTSTSDTKTYSAKRAGEIFYGKDTVEEIQSGETWSASDEKVATTAAIDARIIDLVDDVGGFVPIANETSFPNANPDVNNGAGTLVSIKALSSNLTSNGSGVATISNGTVGNSTVTINGLENSTTYGATLGMIVETTSTLNTYTFHRVTPKATEVTTVASNISSVNTVATSVADVNNFADLYQIATSAPSNDGGGNSLAAGDLWFDSSSNKQLKVHNGTSFQATSPAQSVLDDISIVSGSLTRQEDLGSIADAISSGSSTGALDTCATNITNVNTFANVYRIAANAPSSSLDEGDLWYDSTGNQLKYYNGTAWTVTAAAGLSNIVEDTTPELGGHLDCNDKNLTEVGTVSGDNLQIDFGTL